ncbi:hypothetical protein MPER_11892 [Moniliophthora perniciosa FA553]|nr:hypothetical protein MPER_11892 [Moniliophthora perniciosa FA553]
MDTIEDEIFISMPDGFGLFRIHRYYAPANDTELNQRLEDVYDISDDETEPIRKPEEVYGKCSEDDDGTIAPPYYAPFENPSTMRLLSWNRKKNNRTDTCLTSLVHDVLMQPDFSLDHLVNFNGEQEAKRLDISVDEDDAEPQFPWGNMDGWHRGSVEIPLPRARKRFKKGEGDAPILDVDNVYYRNLYDVIQTEIQLPYAREFVWKPYKLFFQPEGAPVQRVYGEAYTSDRALEFEREIMARSEEIRSNLPDDKKDVEIGVILIIFHSDGMMLASFGTASLWPAYMKLANWSKYPSLRTDSLAWSHISYFPSDIYGEHFQAAASSKELRHVKIELLHAVGLCQRKLGPLRGWHIMSKILRSSIELYDRVMLMTMKYLSEYLCPLCLTKKCDVYQLGLKRDMTRRETNRRHDSVDLRKWVDESITLIYKRGWGVDSEAVNNKLKLGSYLPVRNAFSNLFFEHGLDYPQMFGPDADHDTWGRIRDLLLHNTRILIAKKD